MIRELTPELSEIAKKELNEDPKRLQDDIQHLKDWISKQPHLNARTGSYLFSTMQRNGVLSYPLSEEAGALFNVGCMLDDQWLVALLRGCKFSLERVKKKLDLYYTLRTTAPDITLRIKPTDPKFLDFLRLGTCIVLPKSKNKLMPRFLLIRAGAYDPAKNSVADIMCILYYLVQILVMEDDTATILGTKIVTDYQGVTFNHLAQATPALLKKMVAVSQDSIPLRLRGTHHVNVPSGIEVIFSLVRGIINQKARERLQIHKTNEDLLEHIPKEIVPVEYGGAGGTVAEITEYWAKKIVEYKSWMAQEELLGTDESRRLGEAQTATKMFGVEGVQGSFRKLDID